MNDDTRELNEETREMLGDTLRWALEASDDPSMAAADWLVRDLDASYGTALELLTRPADVQTLRRAKNVFKTMRVVGETAPDRRLGARMYAATIAAALVHHGSRISRQSDSAINRALQGLLDDSDMPEPLRRLAGEALGPGMLPPIEMVGPESPEDE